MWTLHSTLKFIMGKYRVFSVRADWTLTHTSHKDTEQSTIEASITLDGVNTDWLTDKVITEWMTFSLPEDTSVCQDDVLDV
jgi:hypothetical protein